MGLEVQWVFRGVVQAGVPGHGVDAGFIEFGQEVFCRYISIMTGEAVVRREAKRQKTLVGPGIM